MMAQLFLAAFAGVFAAEVLGDKLLYTTGTLATRYRTAPMMGGIALAFMVKMGVAVVVGQALTTLPTALLAGVTAAAFCGIAWRFWKGTPATDATPSQSNSEAAVVSFASVLLIEWGDIGQLTAANLVVQLGNPVIVWCAAVAAMSAKAAIAALVGDRIRRWIGGWASQRVVRVLGLVVVVVLGALSVMEVVGRRH
jgi:Ca2+/H+ antiporter, TMEM165/GDT1 family